MLVNKIRNKLSSTCNITSFPDWISFDKTAKNIKNMHKSIFNQLANVPIPKEFCKTWAKFAKSKYQIAQKAELLKTNLNTITIITKNV